MSVAPPPRLFAALVCLLAVAAASAGDGAAPAAARPDGAGWISTAVARDVRRVELALPAARARDAELRRVEAERHRPSGVFLAFVTLVLALPLAVAATRWLARHPRFRINRQGLAVSLARDRARTTTVIVLSRPERKTTALARDRAREAAVRAAAAVPAGFAEDEPPSNGTTRRIADKHATRQFVRRQREQRQRSRRAAPLGIMRPRGGLTLPETIIALAILAFSLCAVLGSLGGLDHAHLANRDLAQVQEIAQSVIERVQGASWSAFGDPVAVSSQPADQPAANVARILWHRRDPNPDRLPATPPPPPPVPAFAHPPMSDDASDPTSDLTALGLLGQPSGVPGLEVYVSYAALDGPAGPLAARPLAAGQTRDQQWRHVDLPQYRLPEDDAALRERLTGRSVGAQPPVDAFIATVTLRWARRDGGPGSYELSTVRRR